MSDKCKHLAIYRRICLYAKKIQAEDCRCLWEMGILNQKPPCFIPRIDYAKEGSDRTAFQCPTCTTFQELVSPDYLCKQCGEKAVEYAMLGI